MRIHFYQAIFLASAMALVKPCPVSSDESVAPVTIEVISITPGRTSGAEFTIRYRITNLSQETVFCARHGLGKPNGIANLDIQVSAADQKWKALPAHQEIPPFLSEPVKIAVGEKYEDEFSLTRVYQVSGWAAYPAKPYSIILSGKIRLALRYSLGEPEWLSYVSEGRKRLGSASSRADRAQPQRIVYSPPFRLP